jgi:hypothetical protein
MADLSRCERDGEYRDRMMAAGRGFLVRLRTLRGAGAWITSEWLQKNREAAKACLDAVRAFCAAWRVMEAGPPSDALPRHVEALSGTHPRLCEQLDDRPSVPTMMRHRLPREFGLEGAEG